MTQLIGTRLKTLREHRALSQHDLARLLGLDDRHTVAAIEAGERPMTASDLVRAVETLEMPLSRATPSVLWTRAAAACVTRGQ